MHASRERTRKFLLLSCVLSCWMKEQVTKCSIVMHSTVKVINEGRLTKETIGRTFFVSDSLLIFSSWIGNKCDLSLTKNIHIQFIFRWSHCISTVFRLIIYIKTQTKRRKNKYIYILIISFYFFFSTKHEGTYDSLTLSLSLNVIHVVFEDNKYDPRKNSSHPSHETDRKSTRLNSSH